MGLARWERYLRLGSVEFGLRWEMTFVEANRCDLGCMCRVAGGYTLALILAQGPWTRGLVADRESGRRRCLLGFWKDGFRGEM